ncbi:MAG: carbohydrate kinase family protein [bacterium]
MKICVIGSINYDEIIMPNSEKSEGLGGVIYNILPLSFLFKENITIYPVTEIGEDRLEDLFNILKPYKNVDVTGIKINPEGTNQTQLFYRRGGQRDEILNIRSKQITYEDVKPYLDAHIILINFITGMDLTLETIKKIRENSEGLIILDVHSLSLGIDSKGKRYPHPIKNWHRWVENFDVIQVNKHELNMLVNKMVRFRKRDFMKVATKILKQGPRILLVTYGARGARVVYRGEDEYHYKLVRSIPIRAQISPTGCGDVFTAGFIYGYVKYKDIPLATKVATSVASLKCSSKTWSEFFEKLILDTAIN